MSLPPTIDLDGLGLDEGGHLVLERALSSLPVGEPLALTGRHPELGIHLLAWCRAQGHVLTAGPADDTGRPGHWTIRRGRASTDRWSGAARAGSPGVGGVAARADLTWGLAARGALIELGGPPLPVDLVERDVVWSELAPRLYAQAVASQWDPATAVDWQSAEVVPDEIEGAVVQLMTYLIENEQAALMVPARHLGRLHPHFREVMQLLAVQVADEARHVEIFTRRALLHGEEMGTSSVGGRASLQTLLDEPDFSLGSFLLSVLGEGSFLNLLAFIERHAPDPVTAHVARLALQDEARHVAFGIGHLQEAVAADRSLLARLGAAVHRRHAALASTSGLNGEVLDALVILAAGAWTPTAIAAGWGAVQGLQAEMDDGRRRRLQRLGFPADEAAELSALHTRNFM